MYHLRYFEKIIGGAGTGGRLPLEFFWRLAIKKNPRIFACKNRRILYTKKGKRACLHHVTAGANYLFKMS